MYSRRDIPTGSFASATHSSIILRTNAYCIQPKLRYAPIYRYSFTIENGGAGSSKGGQSELEEGEIQEPRQSSIGERDRPLLLREFVKQKSSHIFRKKSGQLVPHAVKLDEMIIYTKEKLDNDGKQSDELPTTIRINWTSEEGAKLLISINYVEEISVTDNVSNPDYLKALNTIVRYKASCSLLNFGQTYFWPTATADKRQKTDIDRMLSCAFGFYLSGVLLTNRGPAIIVDHTAAALTKDENLINLLESFRNGQASNSGSPFKKSRTLEPLQFLGSDEQVVRNFCSSLVGLKCYIRHMKHKQIFRIKKFTQSSASSTKFYWDEKRSDVTISDYFFRKHSIRLRYPNLPCLIKGNQDRVAMYPFELCYLLEDQKLKKLRLNPNIAKRLDQTVELPITDITPTKRSQYSQELNVILNELSKEHLEGFGLELSTRPLKAEGHIIQPPTLRYRDDKLMIPRDGRWKAQKFLTSYELKNWFVVNASTAASNQVRSFVDGFKNYSFIYFGLSMDRPRYKTISDDDANEQAIKTTVSNCIRECKSRNGPQLILFIVNEKNDLYSCIHYVSDILFGVKATCIHDKNIRPISDPRDSRVRFSIPVMTNLSQKINAKLGGINMRNISTEESTIYSSDLINAMFVGCDVTHPDQSSSDASIAACVASCSSDFFQYTTSVRFQERKNDEIVHCVDKMLHELLCTYKVKNDKLPSKIFFYRDGVSEDQFDQVKQFEISKLEDLFSKLYTSEGYRVPRLTFIVVQKRHRMRFFEEPTSSSHQSSSSLKNPRPGMVVDNTVTSRKDDDFYLYSHWNTKGTSRPSHYHVIRNDSSYSMDKLQKITYFMCHTYARCSQSISLPAVVRYAHLAAYRARILLISAKNHMRDEKSPESSSSGATRGTSASAGLRGRQDNIIQLNSLLRNTMYFC